MRITACPRQATPSRDAMVMPRCRDAAVVMANIGFIMHPRRRGGATRTLIEINIRYAGIAGDVYDEIIIGGELRAMAAQWQMQWAMQLGEWKQALVIEIIAFDR